MKRNPDRFAFVWIGNEQRICVCVLVELRVWGALMSSFCFVCSNRPDCITGLHVPSTLSPCGLPLFVASFFSFCVCAAMCVFLPNHFSPLDILLHLLAVWRGIVFAAFFLICPLFNLFPPCFIVFIMLGVLLWFSSFVAVAAYCFASNTICSAPHIYRKRTPSLSKHRVVLRNRCVASVCLRSNFAMLGAIFVRIYWLVTLHGEKNPPPCILIAWLRAQTTKYTLSNEYPAAFMQWHRIWTGFIRTFMTLKVLNQLNGRPNVMYF